MKSNSTQPYRRNPVLRKVRPPQYQTGFVWVRPRLLRGFPYLIVAIFIGRTVLNMKTGSTQY